MLFGISPCAWCGIVFGALAILVLAIDPIFMNSGSSDPFDPDGKDYPGRDYSTC